MNARPSTSRRWARCAAASLGLLLGLGLAELWARAHYGTPLPERLPLLRVQSNPGRGYAMVPGELHYTYVHPVRVNQFGLRGAELGPQAPGELRLLVLGDSLVYGQGVADDQTLPAHLERILTERAERPVRVINGGVRAYATHQELALLRELGPQLAPDVVVLCWYWNDVDERDVEGTAARLAASGPIAFDLGRAPQGWPLLRWRLRQLLRRSALAMAVHDEWLVDGDAHPWTATALADVEALGGYLAQFRELCAELGAGFVVAGIPAAGALDGPHPSQPVAERALALAEQAQVPMRMLAPRGPLPLVPFDGHYAGEGNRALAEDLCLWLAQSGVLDSAE
jgi:hypothetical protein